MKNQIKKFGQFVNESFGRDRESMDRRSNNETPLVATVELSRSMRGEFAIVIFNGNEQEVDEMESLRATWQNILDTAKSMGADLIYSVEDEDIISQEDIDELSDEPSGYM